MEDHTNPEIPKLFSATSFSTYALWHEGLDGARIPLEGLICVGLMTQNGLWQQSEVNSIQTKSAGKPEVTFGRFFRPFRGM